MENASRDENSVPTLLGASNADGKTPVRIYADPATHRLLISGVGVTGSTGSTGSTGPTGPTGPAATTVANGTYTPVTSITVLNGVITAIS